MSAPRRAVITSRGVISPLGCDWPTFASAVQADTKAAPGVFPGSDVPCYLLSDRELLESFATSRDEPLGRLATAAARQALAEAGFAGRGRPLDDVGLVMNTIFGPSTALETYLERLREAGPRSGRPALFVDTLPSMPASRVGIALKLRGSTAVLGGSSAFELALDWVRYGRERAVVAGGGEYQSPKCLRYLQALAERSGVERAVPAQGAAFVVIEELEGARGRGARPLAELLGASAASEPQDVSLPWNADAEGRAFACAMRGALADASLAPEDVRVAVLASGDDATEAAERAALRAVVGEGAARLTLLRPKRQLGEALGAAAGLGLLAALAALEGGEAGVALVNAFEMGAAVTSLALRASVV